LHEVLQGPWQAFFIYTQPKLLPIWAHETIKATINWTILVACCIMDDLLKTLAHHDDPQSKTPASVVLRDCLKTFPDDIIEHE
jgi:hypothetical protein